LGRKERVLKKDELLELQLLGTILERPSRLRPLCRKPTFCGEIQEGSREGPFHPPNTKIVLKSEKGRTELMQWGRRRLVCSEKRHGYLGGQGRLISRGIKGREVSTMFKRK